MCRFSVYYSGSGAGSTTWTGSVWGQRCLLWRLWNVRCLPRNLKNPYWTGVCNGNRSPQMLHFRQSRSSRSLAFGSTGLVYLDWIAIRRATHTNKGAKMCQMHHILGRFRRFLCRSASWLRKDIMLCNPVLQEGCTWYKAERSFHCWTAVVCPCGLRVSHRCYFKFLSLTSHDLSWTVATAFFTLSLSLAARWCCNTIVVFRVPFFHKCHSRQSNEWYVHLVQTQCALQLKVLHFSQVAASVEVLHGLAPALGCRG